MRLLLQDMCLPRVRHGMAPTIDVNDVEGGAEVAEHVGEHAACLSADKGDGRGLLAADLIDALRLLQAAVCDHHHLQHNGRCASGPLPRRLQGNSSLEKQLLGPLPSLGPRSLR